jgi:quercetin dioxygenase-like cupin family protein
MSMKHFKPDKSQARRIEEPGHFEGVVHQQRLLGPEESDEVGYMAVWFDNGARSLPHIHHNDQVLAVVEGTCEVADASERRTVEAGETVMVKRGEWHWHGAAKGHSACHITIKKPGDTDWDVARRNWGER